MIGERILELRREKDWSAAKLATNAKITQAMVTRYEKGEVVPTYKVLKKLAKAFGISIEALTGEGKGVTEQAHLVKDFERRLLDAKAIRSEDAMTTITQVIDRCLELESLNTSIKELINRQPEKKN